MLYIDQLLTSSMRNYIINQVKKPLMKAIIVLADRYPEPTRRNCLHPNTHIMMDIWDEFFKYEDNPGRIELFKAIQRITLAEYEHDPYYRFRIDWFLHEQSKSNWLFSDQQGLMGHWKEPTEI